MNTSDQGNMKVFPWKLQVGLKPWMFSPVNLSMSTVYNNDKFILLRSKRESNLMCRYALYSHAGSHVTVTQVDCFDFCRRMLERKSKWYVRMFKRMKHCISETSRYYRMHTHMDLCVLISNIHFVAKQESWSITRRNWYCAA